MTELANLNILEMSYVVLSRKYENTLVQFLKTLVQFLKKTSTIFTKAFEYMEMCRTEEIKPQVRWGLVGSNLQSAEAEVGEGLNLSLAEWRYKRR